MFKNKLRSIIASSLLINSFVLPIQAMEKNWDKKLSEKIDNAFETISLVQMNRFRPVGEAELDDETKDKRCPQCGKELSVYLIDYKSLYYCPGNSKLTLEEAEKVEIKKLLDHKEKILLDYNFFNSLAAYKERYDKSNLIKDEILKNKLDFLRSFIDYTKLDEKSRLEKNVVKKNFGTLFAYFQILVKKFYDDRCDELQKRISEIQKKNIMLEYVDSKFHKGETTKLTKYFQQGYTTRHELLARNIFIMNSLVEYVFGKQSDYYKIFEQYELLYSQKFFKLVESCLKHFVCDHDPGEMNYCTNYGFGQWGRYAHPNRIKIRALSYLKEEEYGDIKNGVIKDGKLIEEGFEQAFERVAKNTQFYDIGIKLSETAPKGLRVTFMWLKWAADKIYKENMYRYLDEGDIEFPKFDLF